MRTVSCERATAGRTREFDRVQALNTAGVTHGEGLVGPERRINARLQLALARIC